MPTDRQKSAIRAPGQGSPATDTPSENAAAAAIALDPEGLRKRLPVLSDIGACPGRVREIQREVGHGLIGIAPIRVRDVVGVIVGRRDVGACLDDMLSFRPGEVVDPLVACLFGLDARQIVGGTDGLTGYGEHQLPQSC